MKRSNKSTGRSYFWIVFQFGILLIILASCSQESKVAEVEVNEPERFVPQFNADSAYQYIADQVAFGPRVPNSVGHMNCANYLIDKLESFGATVTVQEFQQNAYDGTTLNLKNIIASFHPDKSKRILLAAHWDTRPFADKDSVNIYDPIDGANDGGSGVGVLLEIARIIQSDIPAEVGVDIIFFDGEDYGVPKFESGFQNVPYGGYCLGSLYWSRNKHIPNYSAYYAILLDMVGAKDARFFQEGLSMRMAPSIVKKVWNHASASGYSHYFPRQRSEEIIDDHRFINDPGKIPAIDIIQYVPSSNEDYFGNYHHRHSDNLSVIDKNTLKAVGQTVVRTIYME